MKQFQHGGDVVSFAKVAGCEIDEVIDLSSNINHIRPDINIDFNDIDISPYPNYDDLYKAIAKLYDVDVDQLELFNGASSGIFSLFQKFDTRHCCIYAPAYSEYKKAASVNGYTVELINRFTDIDKYVPPGSLVVFVNPSTPDGNLYYMDTLMEKWMAKNCTILVDESFLEFVYEQKNRSVISYIKKYDKLYIIKSMTKFYSSAGIRIGAVISSKNNIEKLKVKEPAWKISQFDSTYIQEVLKDENFPQVSRTVNIKNKEYLMHILDSSKYTAAVFPAVANFCMVQLKGITAREFQELLKPYRIMVRDCSNFDFLDESFIRVAVKGQKALGALENALYELEKKGSTCK